jgi:hypothetical protein
LTVPRALIKASNNKVQVNMKFDPNVNNAQIKGLKGNWDSAIAYFNQKQVLGNVKFWQGAGAPAAPKAPVRANSSANGPSKIQAKVPAGKKVVDIKAFAH